MLTVAQLVEKSASFCGTQKFIVGFKRARYWTLSWAQPFSFLFILMSFSHLSLCLASCLFSSFTSVSWPKFPLVEAVRSGMGLYQGVGSQVLPHTIGVYSWGIRLRSVVPSYYVIGLIDGNPPLHLRMSRTSFRIRIRIHYIS